MQLQGAAVRMVARFAEEQPRAPPGRTCAPAEEARGSDAGGHRMLLTDDACDTVAVPSINLRSRRASCCLEGLKPRGHDGNTLRALLVRGACPAPTSATSVLHPQPHLPCPPPTWPPPPWSEELFSGLLPLNRPHSPPHHLQGSQACCQGLLLLHQCLTVRPDALGSLLPASSSCQGPTADEPPQGDAADTLSSWTAACKRRSRTIGEHETGAVRQCRRTGGLADRFLALLKSWLPAAWKPWCWRL